MYTRAAAAFPSKRALGRRQEDVDRRGARLRGHRGIAGEAINVVGMKKPAASSVTVPFTSCEHAHGNRLCNQQSASKKLAEPNVVCQIHEKHQRSRSGLARVLLDNKRTVGEFSSSHGVQLFRTALHHWQGFEKHDSV